jgi:hypothetical protein
MEPTFDRDGYPADETLEAISEWTGGPIEWLGFCADAWNVEYGRLDNTKRFDFDEPVMIFITGGWSGNESIIAAMRGNMLWSCLWRSSTSGGRHEFRYLQSDLCGIPRPKADQSDPAPLQAAYDRFKHMDTMLRGLSDTAAPLHQCARDLWLAICAALGKDKP